MAKPDVSGTPVPGSTNVTGGTEVINGAVATLADDVTSINAATQNALTIPTLYKQTERGGFWGEIVGGKTSDGGF